MHYIYGDELKQSAGQARTLAELPVLAMTLREFQVFVVEVCRRCAWNHLVEQYLLGRDGLTGDGDEWRRRAAATRRPPLARRSVSPSRWRPARSAHPAKSDMPDWSGMPAGGSVRARQGVSQLTATRWRRRRAPPRPAGCDE